MLITPQNGKPFVGDDEKHRNKLDSDDAYVIRQNQFRRNWHSEPTYAGAVHMVWQFVQFNVPRSSLCHPHNYIRIQTSSK